MLTSFRILLVLCGLGKKKKKPANINPPPIKQGQYISSLHRVSVSPLAVYLKGIIIPRLCTKSVIIISSHQSEWSNPSLY